MPECFEHGECLDSWLLDFTYEANNTQMCLTECQGDANCEFFTFYEEDKSCLTFANCQAFSTDTCVDCYTGDRACEGNIYRPKAWVQPHTMFFF